uniref:Uncharacterized protein n=1 Tax=Hippocampus comes TaxID=109280 RepID=A0A3Q2YVW0_HIPCM
MIALIALLVEQSRSERCGKDEGYDRMLLDYFLSYQQFIHLVCRVAINCEKFSDTLVKLSCVCADGVRRTPPAPRPLPQTSLLSKTCVKLLCDDPTFSEYIKCILMDERGFLNNNAAYAFLTCFLHKVQVLSGASCCSLAGALAASVLSQHGALRPELASDWPQLSSIAALLNADLRALTLLLSVQSPPTLDPALGPALQELMARCRLCAQRRDALAADAQRHRRDDGRRSVESNHGAVVRRSPASSLSCPRRHEKCPPTRIALPPTNQMAEREEPDRRAGEARAPPLPEDAALPAEEGPEDVLDVLRRTLEAAVAMVTKLTVRAPPSS